MKNLLSQKSLTTPPGGDELLRAAIRQVENLPYVYRVRMFWRDFDQMRDWWLILIPLFLWLGWRRYHRERHILTERRVARQAQAAAPSQHDPVPDQPASYNDPIPS